MQPREQAAEILARRNIFTPGALQLIEQCERDGGLSEDDAWRFVVESLETFRWHNEATVSLETYHALHGAHRLVAEAEASSGQALAQAILHGVQVD